MNVKWKGEYEKWKGEYEKWKWKSRDMQRMTDMGGDWFEEANF